MKISYFNDTDTALIQFTDGEIQETREITEDITIDLDSEGNLVSMTVEHAQKSANIRNFAFQHMADLAKTGS